MIPKDKLEAIRQHASSDPSDAFGSDLILELVTEISRLQGEIDSPHTTDFLEAVRLEAAHQMQRWSDTDKVKEDFDWYWTLSYLAGKAIRPDATLEKKLHPIITSAAMCLNWHRYSREINE